MSSIKFDLLNKPIRKERGYAAREALAAPCWTAGYRARRVLPSVLFRRGGAGGPGLPRAMARPAMSAMEMIRGHIIQIVIAAASLRRSSRHRTPLTTRADCVELRQQHRRCA
jgi:hypothetical protein